MRDRIHFVWHMHQPFFVPDDEIQWRIRSTYVPLLDAFTERELNFSLNITGGLLNRISELDEHFLDRLTKTTFDAKVPLLGSGMHHPILSWLDRHSASLQIERDLASKHAAGFQTPSTFYSTDMAWSHFVGQIVHRYGYSSMIVDSKTLEGSNKLPIWESTSGRMELVDYEREYSKHTKVALELGEGQELDAIVRDSEVTTALLSAMHDDAEDRVCFATFKDRFHEEQAKYSRTDAPIVVVEDAERFLPQKLERFLYVLDAIREGALDNVSLATILGDEHHERLTYLPAGVFEQNPGLWSSGHDDMLFNMRIREAAAEIFSTASLRNRNELLELLLEIQDSAFYLWPYISRTRRPFYEKLFQIHELIGGVTD